MGQGQREKQGNWKLSGDQWTKGEDMNEQRGEANVQPVAEAGKEVGGAVEAVTRGAVLTERDKRLLGSVAIARYLSTEQIHRLIFPGRSLPPCRRRLLRLAGEWKSTNKKPTRAGVHENFRHPVL